MTQGIQPSLRTIVLLIAQGAATSRAGIARYTGLARSTVSQHVDVLLRHGIVEEQEVSSSVRGRPPRALRISPRFGAIAVICVDTTITRLALATLTGTLIDRTEIRRPCAIGPRALLGAATSAIEGMLDHNGFDRDAVQQIVAGLPAPVDFAHGRTVQPPIMPGWDGYPVGDHLRDAFGCPTVVDNDVNLVALGEANQDRVETPLIAIKVATGIGAGIVNANGEVHRGADGAAGDIGHIRIAGHDDVICTCGNTGCLEAVSSYDAVLRQLGIDTDSDADRSDQTAALLARLATGDTTVIRAIRSAASDIGQVAAMLVHTYNPRSLVLVGPLAELRDELLAGVRAAVYARALPLATRKLTITTSQLGPHAETSGAVTLATQTIFSPSGIERLLGPA